MSITEARNQASPSSVVAVAQGVMTRLEEAWNAADGAAFAEPFSADADFVAIRGDLHTGSTAIAEGHQQIFDTIYRDTHNVATVQGIRFHGTDVAIVHVGWQLTFRQDQAVHKSMCTMMMAKSSDAWSIIAFQNTPVVSR